MGKKRGIQCDVKIGGRLMFPKKYISADDLQGKDFHLTIATVSGAALQTDDGGTEDKWLMGFREAKKKLVLNKTNVSTLGRLLGNNADEWPGQRITLYATQCQSFGQMVDCVRIREKKPAANAAGQDTAHLDDIGDENGNGHEPKGIGHADAEPPQGSLINDPPTTVGPRSRK